jgi:mRNA degradation ribonuclease J1/J2
MIAKIDPKTIIPIHTTKPELFETMFASKVIFPKYGKSIDV